MPNRDGSGPFGDGRLGKGLGNCLKSRRTGIARMRGNNNDTRGIANSGITLLKDAIRYFLTRQENNRR